MISVATVYVRVRIAWWLPFYLSGVKAMCLLTNGEPDWTKVQHWIMRGIRATTEAVNALR